MFKYQNQFLSIENNYKQSQAKFLESQAPQQKYLISDKDGTRTLNEAMRLIQTKKITKIHICQKCNKKFQSLTALSTHSKKQHNFIPNINGEQRRRGRPSKNAPRPNDQIIQWQQQFIQKQQEELMQKKQSSLSSINPDEMKSIKYFPRCDKITSEQGLISKERIDEKESIQRILNLLQAVGEEQEIMNVVDEINANCNEEQEFYLNEDTSINLVLAAFLINVGTFATNQILRLIIIFIKSFIKYVSSRNLEQTSDKCWNRGEKNRNSPDGLTASQFSSICNPFLYQLNTIIKDFDTRFAILLLKDICDWIQKETNGSSVLINL